MTELLVVICIMSILMLASSSALRSIINSAGLTQGAGAIEHDLNLARMTAVARNRLVVVSVFYDTKASTLLGTQVFYYADNANGTSQWIAQAKPHLMPNGIALKSKYSTVVGKTLLPATPALPIAPGILRLNAQPGRIDLRFNGDGSFEWDDPESPCLTIALSHDNSSTLPANYVSLVIEPYTGYVRTYRP